MENQTKSSINPVTVPRSTAALIGAAAGATLGAGIVASKFVMNTITAKTLINYGAVISIEPTQIIFNQLPLYVGAGLIAGSGVGFLLPEMSIQVMGMASSFVLGQVGGSAAGLGVYAMTGNLSASFGVYETVSGIITSACYTEVMANHYDLYMYPGCYQNFVTSGLIGTVAGAAVVYLTGYQGIFSIPLIASAVGMMFAEAAELDKRANAVKISNEATEQKQDPQGSVQSNQEENSQATNSTEQPQESTIEVALAGAVTVEAA